MNLESRTKALVKRCQNVAQAAAKGSGWVDDVAHESVTVEQQSLGLNEALDRIENAARRLGIAAGRRMCIGVFGPSQAGKSYLVNSFGRGGGDHFNVRLGDQEFDFLEKINPQNEGESSGLVTRFSTALPPAEPGAPVRLRFLSETDLVKIVVNSFQEEIDHKASTDFELPGAAAVKARLDELERAKQGPQTGWTDGFPITDLKEYLFDHYEKPYSGITAARYWERASELAPHLVPSDRVRLFSLLWGDEENFTRLFDLLLDGLETLGYPADGFCGLDALMIDEGGEWKRRQHDNILNVEMLYKLGSDDGDSIAVTIRQDGGGTRQIQLARPLVTALTAELQLELGHDSYPFFEQADLLDFPGARGRKKVRSFLEGAGKVEEGEDPILKAAAYYLLRGKVEYLFQRYMAERELTGILLCMPPSNLEANVLGPMVKSWVARTLGQTPQARAENPNTLFLLLTKFDSEFDVASGQDEASLKARWGKRLEEGLYKLYSEYANDWDGKPFRNSYWVRNPAFKNRNLMDYDENGVETGVQALQQGYIDRMAAYCTGNELVGRHFGEPEKAFREALRIQDGGVAYLVDNLSAVCQPDLKLRQIENRIEEQAGSLMSALGPLYDDDSGSKRSEKRRLADKTVQGLRACIANERFGDLIAQLQFIREDIWPLHAGIGVLAEEDAEAPAPSVNVSGAIDLDEVFSGITPTEQTDQSSVIKMDRAARFADEVLKHWSQKVLRLAGNEALRTRLSVDEETLRAIAQELSRAAERCRVRERLADEVRRETSHANVDWDGVGARVVLIAERVVSNFIAELGTGDLPEDARPGVPYDQPLRKVFETPEEIDGLPHLPDAQRANVVYMQDWLNAFIHLVVENAAFKGGGEISEQHNMVLGDILGLAKPDLAAE